MLLAEKKNTPVLHVVKHRELSQHIAELTEDIEELKPEKATLLRILDCDDVDIADFKKDLASQKENLMDLEQHEQKYTSELDTALQQYHHLEGQTQDIDSAELQKSRLSLRPEKKILLRRNFRKRMQGNLIRRLCQRQSRIFRNY